MTQTVKPAAPAAPTNQRRSDDSNRVKLGLSNRLLARPDVGAFIAAVVILVFFLITAPTLRSAASFSNVLFASATIGVVAVGVGMLMIGGEFDLSAGVASITTGATSAMFSYQLGLNLWVGLLVSLILAILIGLLNGYLVVRTGIPSFLITLGTFFVLQGANLGVTKLVTGSVSTNDISDMDGYSTLHAIFAGTVNIGSLPVNTLVFWWIGFVALSSWILTRTRVGNWIFAAGGNPASARAVGVPVAKVKIGLFVTVTFLAWFVGQATLYGYSTLQAGAGVGNEFFYIIAAVVGGTLMTGGFGNAIGVALGSFIFGLTSLGIVYAGWDPNWFKAFLGIMLLLAVLVNLYIKKLSTTRKVG